MSEDIRILFGQKQSEIKFLASHLLLSSTPTEHGAVLYEEDFESYSVGVLPPDFNIEAGATAGWVVTDSEFQEGTQALMSEDINDNENASVELTLEIEQNFDLSFFYKASSEGGFDVLNFYVDGVNKFTASGMSSYSEYTETLTAGTYTFKWDFSKDGSVSSLDDTAYIDNITITLWDQEPSAPTGLQTTSIGETQIDLAWDANSEPDLDGYNVYVDGVAHNGALVGTNSYSVTGLDPDSSYEFKVTAVNTDAEESGFSNIVNASTTGPNSNNFSLGLDGAADYGEVAHDGSLTGFAGITLMAWVKITDTGVNYSTTFRTVMSKGTHSFQDYGLIVHSQDPNAPKASWITFIVKDNAGNQIRLQTNYAAAFTNDQDEIFPNDEWHHIAAGIDGSESKILVDGVRQDLFESDGTPLTNSGPALANPLQAFTNPLRLGWDGGSDRYFPGNLDEQFIFNTLLADATINTYKDQLLEGNETNLVWGANYEDNAGVVTDITGNGNNGTLQGDAVIETDAVAL